MPLDVALDRVASILGDWLVPLARRRDRALAELAHVASAIPRPSSPEARQLLDQLAGAIERCDLRNAHAALLEIRRYALQFPAEPEARP